MIWAATITAIYDDEPVGLATDGLQAGTGLSYEFLSWSASANYIYSNVGIWRDDGRQFKAHTGILSLRYKITPHLNAWASGGGVHYWKNDWFAAAGIGLAF